MSTFINRPEIVPYTIWGPAAFGDISIEDLDCVTTRRMLAMKVNSSGERTTLVLVTSFENQIFVNTYETVHNGTPRYIGGNFNIAIRAYNTYSGLTESKIEE